MVLDRLTAPSTADDEPRPTDDEPSPTRPGTAILWGVQGGFVATVVMTIYRLPVFRALPPTAEFWARYFGGEAEQHTGVGIVLHFLYGSAAGAVFGLLFSRLDPPSPLGREWAGIVTGAIYGVALSLFGTSVIFPFLLDRELDPDHELVFHVGHVVYGLTLGTWLSTREGVGDVYEEARRPAESGERP